MTWIRCSSLWSGSQSCKKAACSLKERPMKSKATPRCRKPISAACMECSNELARGHQPEQLLRRLPHPVRRLDARRKERGCGASRPQRCRKEHDAEESDGRCHAAYRPSDIQIGRAHV